MHQFHLTRELLRAVDNNKRDPGDLHDLVLGHLFQLCSTCREEYDRWHAERSTGRSPESYAVVVDRVIAASEEIASEVEAERQAAQPKLETLLAIPAEQRRAAIEQAPREYQGPAIAELLIRDSLGQMPGRPREAMALSELAMVVLNHSELSGYVVELYARATAHAANSLRVLGRLPEASLLLDSSRFLLRSEGGGDRLVRAELDHMEGTLCRDQRRFDQAEALLQRAILTFVGMEMPEQRAGCLLDLGLIYQERQDGEQAAQAAEKAAQLLDPETEPALYLYARHNLALSLCELGRFEEAGAVLTENAPLYARYGDQLSQLRVAWVEGKVARGLGNLEEAESHFLVSRYGFLRHEIAFDAALVSLELASLYLETGRTAKVQELAAEMVAVFNKLEIHREATTALVLFQDASRMNRVNLELIHKLSTYLAQAQRDPAHVFELGPKAN